MSAEIARLVAKPTLADDIKVGVVKLARAVLEDAESGQASTILVICVRPDGTWSREWSGTQEMAAMIGRLEITKQEWIASYSKEYGAPTP